MQSQPSTKERWTDAEASCLLRGLAMSRPPRPDQPGTSDRCQVLAGIMQDAVIPRLLAGRPGHAARAPVAAGQLGQVPPGDADIARLVALLLADGAAGPAAYVQAMRDSGTPLEALLLDLLTPAARLLGQKWEDDTASFSEVTLGMLRLAGIMRRLDCAFDGDTRLHAARPSALLVQVPGEQHGFGLAMVALFFRGAGWNVRQAPGVTSAGLVDLVRTRWFGLVGISVACNERMSALADDIRAIRRHSRNRSIGVMVGGPAFLAHPQLAELVGADATATDGRQAVIQGRRLAGLQAGRA